MLIRNPIIKMVDGEDVIDITSQSCDIGMTKIQTRGGANKTGMFVNENFDEVEITVVRGVNPLLDGIYSNQEVELILGNDAVAYDGTFTLNKRFTVPNDTFTSKVTTLVFTPTNDPFYVIGSGGGEGGYEPDKETIKLNAANKLYVFDYISKTDAENLVKGNVPFSLSDPSLSSIQIGDIKYKIETGIGDARWGNIDGNIEDQEDLIEKFDDYATSEALGEEIINRQDEDRKIYQEIDTQVDTERQARTNADANMVTLNTTQNISGSKTFTSGNGIRVSQAGIATTGYKADSITFGNYTLNFPRASGTIALEGQPSDVYWSTLPFSSSDDTLITEYLTENYVDNHSDQTIEGFKTFTDSDGLKVADSDGLNYVRYGAGTIHYKRLDVDDEFDYLLPSKSGTFALYEDVPNNYIKNITQSGNTYTATKQDDSTISWTTGGSGGDTIYLVDAELDYETGDITWNTDSIKDDVLAYFDENGYFPTIKLHLVVKYRGTIAQEDNCDSSDTLKLVSEGENYLRCRFIIDGISSSSSTNKLEVQQFIYEDYGSDGRVGEVVEFSTESFSTSKYYDKKSVEDMVNAKQDTLIPGDNITIVDNVISAQTGERAPTYVITAEYNSQIGGWEITSDNYYSQIVQFYETNNYYPSIFLRIEQNNYEIKYIASSPNVLNLSVDITDASDLFLRSQRFNIVLNAGAQAMEESSRLIDNYAIKAEYTTDDEIKVTQMNYGEQDVLTTPKLQKKLTPGDNISIVEDVISANNQLKNMYIHYVHLTKDTTEMYADSTPELFIITDDPTPYTSIYRFFEDTSASNKVSYRGPLQLVYTNEYGNLDIGFAHVLFTMLEESSPGVGALVFDYQLGATPDDGIVRSNSVRRITFDESNSIIRDEVVPLFPNIFYCDYQFEHCSTQQSKWYIPGQHKFVLVTPDEGYKLPEPEDITHSDNLTYVVLDNRGYLSFDGINDNSWIKITAIPENKR